MKITNLCMASALCLMTAGVSESHAGLKDKLCEKGSLFSGKITVRSFKGKFCKIGVIGKWALKNCKGIDDFEDSGCYKNAKKSDHKDAEVLSDKEVEELLATMGG